MAREITFPKTGDIWINAETGVWIERGFHNGGFGYIVRVPAWVGQRSYTTAAVKSYLRDARATAHDVAEGMRAQIARAQREALVSFAIVMADRAEASIAAATHEEALTGEEAHRLFSYLTTARLFRETDPERSIGWSNEILSEVAKVADRETGAAKTEAQRGIELSNKQITDWLDSHGVNFHGATSEGIDETVREYHAGIAADHEEAILMDRERAPRSQAPQLDGGRPAYWGTAWLEVSHPAHIDMITQEPALDSVRFLRFATEPQRGRFFPGPM